MPMKLSAGRVGDGETELDVVEIGSLGLDDNAKPAALFTSSTHGEHQFSANDRSPTRLLSQLQSQNPMHFESVP